MTRKTCEWCGQELVWSAVNRMYRAPSGYYCPKDKDEDRGQHIPVSKHQEPEVEASE